MSVSIPPDSNELAAQAEALRSELADAEDEIHALRRRLQESPGRVQALEERLLESKGQLAHATSQNEKLTFTLQQAKEQLAALREEVEKLTQPPGRLRHLPRRQRGRHGRRLLQRAQDAGQRSTPTSTPASSARATRSC